MRVLNKYREQVNEEIGANFTRKETTQRNRGCNDVTFVEMVEIKGNEQRPQVGCYLEKDLNSRNM